MCHPAPPDPEGVIYSNIERPQISVGREVDDAKDRGGRHAEIPAPKETDTYPDLRILGASVFKDFKNEFWRLLIAPLPLNP